MQPQPAPAVDQPIADGTPLVVGDATFAFGRDAAELRDSSPLRDDPQALRARLAEDGYLLIRGFHPRPLAEAAAARTLDAIAERGGLRADADRSAGSASDEQRSFSFFRDVAVAHHPAVLDAVDGPHAFAFFHALFGRRATTFDKRWLRAMARGGSNGFHCDSAYVGAGTRERLTMWSALTPIGLDGGPLLLCLGSHRHERLRWTYGCVDMDLDQVDPVFSTDPREMVERFGFRLGTARFAPGDAVIFGLHLMHASAPNRTGRYRISIDTRYQPADQPSDPRFHGAHGRWLGNFHRTGASYRPMRELRALWGL